jgi:hypothetical protein
MTVGLSTSPNQYIGDGILDTYPYDFKIFAETDIEVYVDEVLLTGGYSLTGIGNGTGGNVVFDNEHIPGNQVSIVFSRNLPITQEIHYIEGDKFLADTHETGLDREVMLIQRLYEGFKKTIRLPMYSLIEDIYLTPEANKYLKWNSEGDGIEGADLGEIFPGIGDMLRSVYDTDSDGIVDDSERLGGSLPSAFSLTTHNHSGVYSPLIHDHIQANITGLTISDSPVFVTAKLSGLTDGYLPYHISDMVGLGNSPIFTDGINIGFKTSSPGSDLDIAGTSSLGAELRLRQKTSSSTYIGLKAPDIIEDSITYLLPLNGSNGQVWSLIDALTGETGWITPASGGAETFLALTDVPSSYTGEGTKFVRVNEGESALEFVDAPGGVGGSGAVNRVSIWSDASILSSDPAFTFITPTLTLSNSVAGGKTSLATRNTDGGTGSYNQINIGNNTAADEFYLRINSSGFTSYAGYTYIWSKYNAPMLFGVNNNEAMRITTAGLDIKNSLIVESSSYFQSTLGIKTHQGEHWTYFNTGPQIADIIYTLPTAQASGTQWLKNVDGVWSWDTPAGFGDMLKAIYDPDINGIFAVAQGGTNKSSWTQYAIPYLSGPTTFGEIAIGTSGKFLKSLGTNYMWDIPTALAGGSSRQFQYNNAGVLGGTSPILYVASGTSVDIQNAINSLPSTGGIIYVAGGTFNAASTLYIQGSDATVRNGVALIGAGPDSTIIKKTSGGGTVVEYSHMGSGYVLDGIQIDGNNNATKLLRIVSAQRSNFRNFRLLNVASGGTALELTCENVSGAWSSNNKIENFFIQIGNAYGITLHGNTVTNLNDWHRNTFNTGVVQVLDSSSPTSYYPVVLDYCDSNTWFEVDIGNIHTTTKKGVHLKNTFLDYPQNNWFYGCSIRAVYSTGTPDPNFFYGFSVADGESRPYEITGANGLIIEDDSRFNLFNTPVLQLSGTGIKQIHLYRPDGTQYWNIMNNQSDVADYGLQFQKNGTDYFKIDPHGDSNNPIYLYVGGSLKHITIDGSGFLKGV